MSDAVAPGTEGYHDNAAERAQRYGALDFDEVHAPVLSLIPESPASILDVGAGSGRAARWFAGRGHRVLAAEPVDALREEGRLHFDHPNITCAKGALPELHDLAAPGVRFDLVWLSAVWAHIPPAGRGPSMARLAPLLVSGGAMMITLRHGTAGPAHRVHPVSAQETIALARSHGLRCEIKEVRPSVQHHNRAAGVTWTHLGLRKPCGQ